MRKTKNPTDPRFKVVPPTDPRYMAQYIVQKLIEKGLESKKPLNNVDMQIVVARAIKDYNRDI